MDYSLAALKLLCIQLKAARASQDSSPSSISLGSILFQRAWIQGVIISLPSSSAAGDGRFLIDDGTGVIELLPLANFVAQDWKLGAYVMAVGRCTIRTDNIPLIQIHKIVDLSAYHHREAMWYLEVIEAYKLFYQPPIEYS
uniref:uncharacterized protein LOC122582671 n=1 Tax=Erigeron canadensis TaxID=72917 RepID=UPI001CB9BDFA|nr:uncharacterized protein LOC122582671 [Erigeron canadensis]XP_043611034.1 uncharacterized protein LOC122582671 [Erigeron canadensis]